MREVEGVASSVLKARKEFHRITNLNQVRECFGLTDLLALLMDVTRFSPSPVQRREPRTEARCRKYGVGGCGTEWSKESGRVGIPVLDQCEPR